ncbi:hypothetical protein [Parasitella parasitica]|uniref:RlpA-like protein double-psi beta-barrel domain-containing protein n=1 Tax=Parasitella parasitica TaxID=35722 RepID=A0A0B7MX90_9FUNG|nr:hypothetical protein [Parasitella parasitica]
MQFSFSSALFILTTTFAMFTQAAPVPNIRARSSMSGGATFYSVGLGSCGYSNSNEEMVAALSASLMGGANSALCGKSITVKSSSGSVTLKVVDSCPGCSEGDVDMSEAAFKKIGDPAQGRIPITWSL